MRAQASSTAGAERRQRQHQPWSVAEQALGLPAQRGFQSQRFQRRRPQARRQFAQRNDGLLGGGDDFRRQLGARVGVVLVLQRHRAQLDRRQLLADVIVQGARERVPFGFLRRGHAGEEDAQRVGVGGCGILACGRRHAGSVPQRARARPVQKSAPGGRGGQDAP